MRRTVRLIRTLLTGAGPERFTFHPADRPQPARIDAAHVYIHVPLCRQFCPYCPYYKEPYDSATAAAYADGLRREIALLAQAYGRMAIGSVYIGGGTPTLLGAGLGAVLDELRRRFDLSGEIALELHPLETTTANLAQLRDAGVTLASLGVQSFDDRHLKTVGRAYDANDGARALERVLEAGFDAVNADLLFALPGQSLCDLRADLDKAIAYGVDQLTAYPLFTFSYTAIGQHLRLNDLRLPPILARRRQYRFLHTYLPSKGYDRATVWAFKRDAAPRYSSVLRHAFLGLGAGAGSHLPGSFHFNTFNIDAYLRQLADGRFPTALRMPMTPQMERYYWLYWQLYATRFSAEALKAHFPERDLRLAVLLRLGRLAGMIRREAAGYALSERGAFWVHWLQNHALLHSIDELWTHAIAEPFPAPVRV